MNLKSIMLWEKKEDTKEYTLYDCHLHEILEQAKLICLDRKQISGWLGMRMTAIDCKGAWGSNLIFCSDGNFD